MPSDSPNKDQPNHDLSKSFGIRTPISSSVIVNLPPGIMAMLSTLIKKLGVHTSNYLLAAGFKYTGDGDTAKCDDCELEISNWTTDMNPFTIHSETRPRCSFIRSLNLTESTSASSSATVIRHISTPNEHENPSQHRAAGVNMVNLQNTLFEVNILQEVRRRTFSHWPHRTSPSAAQMIEAGFFYCNVGDRVICIYCNLICQQWTPHSDDPCEVHKTLSPNCIYVKSKLVRRTTSSIVIINESSSGAATGNHLPKFNILDTLQSNEIVYTAASNPAYIGITERCASFARWPHGNLPSADHLVRAGFFYTGNHTAVTCFYCNGSLQNWGLYDNPTVEHARWFPHCAYARQLCGNELYREIQESKRAQQGMFKHNKTLCD
jgi:hypothetical protein